MLCEFSELRPSVRNGVFLDDISELVSDANSVFNITEVDSDNRSDLLILCIILSFHKMVEYQIAGATSTTFSFYLVRIILRLPLSSGRI